MSHWPCRSHPSPSESPHECRGNSHHEIESCSRSAEISEEMGFTQLPPLQQYCTSKSVESFRGTFQFASSKQCLPWCLRTLPLSNKIPVSIDIDIDIVVDGPAGLMR